MRHLTSHSIPPPPPPPKKKLPCFSLFTYNSPNIYDDDDDDDGDVHVDDNDLDDDDDDGEEFVSSSDGEYTTEDCEQYEGHAIETRKHLRYPSMPPLSVREFTGNNTCEVTKEKKPARSPCEQLLSSTSSSSTTFWRLTSSKSLSPRPLSNTNAAHNLCWRKTLRRMFKKK